MCVGPTTQRERDPHYISGTSKLSFQEAYGSARPTPENNARLYGSQYYARPGDPGWTGELPHPYSWMESFKDETNREQYYSSDFVPSELLKPSNPRFRTPAKKETWDEWNPPDWHYDRTSRFYEWLPDDMQRGEGSPWKIKEDARNRHRLRVKNEVKAGSGAAYGRDPGSYGGTSHRSQGVNL